MRLGVETIKKAICVWLRTDFGSQSCNFGKSKQIASHALIICIIGCFACLCSLKFCKIFLFYFKRVAEGVVFDPHDSTVSMQRLVPAKHGYTAGANTNITGNVSKVQINDRLSSRHSIYYTSLYLNRLFCWDLSNV